MNRRAPSSVSDSARAARIRTLIDSPAYRIADHDVDFLDEDELRHARLELEYLKPEIGMSAEGVESVIVLFGGTRLIEPAAAQSRVARLLAESALRPEDTALRRELAVARRIAAKSHYYDVAREFAQLVSRCCHAKAPGDFIIMTGGGPGVMEAGNRGAFEAGRKSVGLNIELPEEQGPNSFVTPSLCFQFRYFALRKLHFMMRAKALVAFPGGYGTFDELFDALCLVQTGKMEAIPIILVGEAFWRRAFDADFLAEEGMITSEDLSLFSYAESAEEIWAQISSWYKFDADECVAPMDTE